MIQPHSKDIRAVKRPLTSKHFIGNTGQGVLIAFLADHALKLLRGHIWRGTTGIYMLDTGSFQHGCNAEIAQQSIIIAIKEDILRFKITVDEFPADELVVKLHRSGQEHAAPPPAALDDAHNA